MIPGRFVLTTPPAAEPVSVAEAKEAARYEDVDQDARFARLVAGARLLGERWTGRAWITQGWTAFLAAFPAGREPLLLRWPPVQSVTSITWRDPDGVVQTLDPALYDLVPDPYRPRVVLTPGADWPRDLEVDRAEPVTVVYVAGYGAAGANVPEPYRLGVEALVATWFDDPQATVVGTTAAVLPFSVEDLWAHERVIPVAV